MEAKPVKLTAATRINLSRRDFIRRLSLGTAGAMLGGGALLAAEAATVKGCETPTIKATVTAQVIRTIKVGDKLQVTLRIERVDSESFAVGSPLELEHGSDLVVTISKRADITAIEEAKTLGSLVEIKLISKETVANLTDTTILVRHRGNELTVVGVKRIPTAKEAVINFTGF